MQVMRADRVDGINASPISLNIDFPVVNCRETPPSCVEAFLQDILLEMEISTAPSSADIDMLEIPLPVCM